MGKHLATVGPVAKAWKQFINTEMTDDMTVKQVALIRKAWFSGMMFIMEGLAACASNDNDEAEASAAAEKFVGGIIEEMDKLSGG